ncbi:uncharacterized protein LOC129332807 [Eublepharis macularius]|uniref:Uncharacterized protein LOC129332807 n=1 Tax=Eublepharis macularius TaxID=481883 RepID=A0AA97JJL4_EUBMA|nr:uncharacterized protein LOC129332807 [Eublepharis macularius]XP_054840044.1 uncharacterized protein LOC129332807 [Eublepharis macularius]XP_054840045.1 uncharacterized protein LOC129332807 [Eublepharis macularius]XP_054840046.1 uncharacterized protein LOC129332807 [Eublepharis macularius]XP_054840048.1 uncharacterized protein LOC129332807 [Eublepharis macularius]XP_054840049.1 uncharacterized protein LOC129332807 [Eublepharis macularius]
MGRPRKTADSVSSPRPAATAPKAAPSAPRSSASSKMTAGGGRASSAPAAKTEGSRRGQGEKLTSASSSSGTGQSYQTRSTAAHSSSQGDAKSSRGARAKTSTASGGGKSHAVAAEISDSAARPSQAATKKQGRTNDFSPPLDVAEIESKTRGQRTNPEWYKWRENRITASVAPKIANSKFVNGRSSEVPQSYLKAVVDSGSSVMTPAMSWGVRNEKKAVQAYEALKSTKTKSVTVDNCGIFIDKDKSWLAASPDGIVREAKTGKPLSVLEVKCPYKHRDKTVTDACKDKDFCLKKEGESYSLKKNHPYYTQVQCQMGVTGLKKADFVVHTNKETAIAPVDFDPVFWDSTVPKLEKFYTDAVVPHLEQKQNVAAWAKEE